MLYQKATGIPLQTGRKKQPFRRKKEYNTRIKHRTGNSKCRRYRRLIGRLHWKSSYDNTAELQEKERKRIAREKKCRWLEEQKRKEQERREKLPTDALAREAERRRKKQTAELKPPEKCAA